MFLYEELLAPLKVRPYGTIKIQLLSLLKYVQLLVNYYNDHSLDVVQVTVS